MAKVNMDAFPWDLTISLGGRDYPTVPMTVEALLADAESPPVPSERPSDKAAIERAIGTVKRLFPPDNCPALEKLDWLAVVSIRDAYACYLDALLKKKRLAARQAILEGFPMPAIPGAPAGPG